MMAELVVALDVPDAPAALALAGQLKGAVSWLKVGLQLFIAEGPGLVEQLRESGFRVFLDLKFYDIPNTVASAVKSACALGAGMLTLHLQGGRRMCEEAIRALPAQNPPLLLGVTALTSFAAGEMPGIAAGPCEFGRTLAALAVQWGMGGVVCSGQEAAAIKSRYPALACLCPGIRPAAVAGDDQARAMTPQMAVQAGADYLVVGRPVLRARNPRLAALEILAAMRGVAEI